jgi:dolichol-phosphate mannosyltransferase
MRVLVAIPVYDEERHLNPVLDSVRRHYEGDILVIDDGSTDATPELLLQRGDVMAITHPENRGYGQSMIDAFRFACRRGYDWVITLDCDGQHDPAALPEFIAAALAADGEGEGVGADIISGSRYLREMGGNDRPPPDRRAINMRLTRMLNDLLGLRLTDSFCGYKAYRVSAVNRLKLTVPGYAFPMQFWVQSVRAGLRVRELPVKLIYNDPNRYFGGLLDDPDSRMQHYLDVLINELHNGPRFTASEAEITRSLGCL